MAKVIHSMIRVLDLDKSMRFYADVLGMEASHRLDFPDFSLGTCATRTTTSKSSSRSTKGHEEPYTHGTGYGHIACVVPDVAAFRAELLSKGHDPAPVKEFKRGDELLARFFFIQDPDGYKIEVLEQHGHYR